MTENIQFINEAGGRFRVEVDDAKANTHGGVVPAGVGSRANGLGKDVSQSFEQALDIVNYNSQAFIKKISQLSDVPDNMELTFGLKATIEGDFIIAKGGMEANYTVKLSWNKK